MPDFLPPLPARFTQVSGQVDTRELAAEYHRTFEVLDLGLAVSATSLLGLDILERTF